MNLRLSVALVLLAAIVGTAMLPGCSRREEQQLSSFAQYMEQSDHLGTIAVHADGRVKSYGSFARSMMQFVSGPRVVRGQSPGYTYMDLMLRPRAYEDRPLIYIKNKPMREQIAAAFRQSIEQSTQSMWAAVGAAGSPDMSQQLEQRLAELDQRMDQFMDTGMVAANVLNDPAVVRELNVMRQDLIRTARFVDDVDNALAVSDPEVLRRSLRVVPPFTGGFHDRWLTFEELSAKLGNSAERLTPSQIDLATQILSQWDVFQRAWQAGDAPAADAAAASLAGLLPQVNPELYPGENSRTGWPWSVQSVDWKWLATIGLFFGLLALALVALAAGWSHTGTLSLTCALGFGAFVTAGYALGRTNPLALESWYFATRNMTWVWLLYAASLIPLALSVVFRWRGAHWLGMGLFMVAFGFHTAAILIRWYVSDRWPNSNMFEAVTTAAWFGACWAVLLEVWVRKLPLRSVFALGGAASGMVALMCAYFMPVGLDPNIRNMMPVLHDVWLYIHTNVIILSYCLIFMAAVTAGLYLLYRLAGALMGFSGPQDYARMGGAASIIQITPDGSTYIEKAKANIAQVLDGTTMILMEMSFVLLWAGLVMGAIWADHSWGRPWGWDPKEVFALNTFIVFLVLIHGRLKARDKGVWTAVTALIGAGVMLFNWIAINFVVVGLHSYA